MFAAPASVPHNTSNDTDPQLALAQRRTDVAIERTALAIERTYSAWLRTGLAAIATGFAIAELLVSLQPRWAFRTIGAVFILAGVVTLVLAHGEYRAALRRHDRLTRTRTSRSMAAVLLAALVLAAVVGMVLAFLN